MKQEPRPSRLPSQPRPSRLPSQPRPRDAATVRAVGAGPPLAPQRSLGRAARAGCEVIARGRKERAVAEPLFRRGAWRGERAGRSGPRAGGRSGHGEQDGGRAPGADGGRGGLGGGAARGLRARAPLAVPARVPAAQCGRAAGGGQRRAAATRLPLHGVGQPRLPGLPVSCAAGVRAGSRLAADGAPPLPLLSAPHPVPLSPLQVPASGHGEGAGNGRRHPSDRRARPHHERRTGCQGEEKRHIK